jgi:hypothetical protein
MLFLMQVLAVLWGWETIRGLLPLSVNARFIPLCVVLLAFGVLYLHGPFLLAPAISGGVALLRKLSNIESLKPWAFPYWEDIKAVTRPPRRGPGRVNPGAQGRPPKSTVGNRIPKL